MFSYRFCTYAQILFPVHHNRHWTVYCINLVHEQIDILDSLAWATDTEMKQYHRGIARKIRQRLNAAIQRYTHDKFTDFSKWNFVFVPVPKQAAFSNDCAFFAMLFLEYYDGEKRKLDIDINPVSICLLEFFFVGLFSVFFILSPTPLSLVFFWITKICRHLDLSAGLRFSTTCCSIESTAKGHYRLRLSSWRRHLRHSPRIRVSQEHEVQSGERIGVDVEIS